MIKFFRHIRKSLLMENKTSKYFKYAIGEIILVVIGILIALQVNNWNQERVQKIELNDLLNSVANNIESDINSLKLIKSARENIHEQSDSIGKYYKQDNEGLPIYEIKALNKEQANYFAIAYKDLVNTVIYQPNLSAFDALKNSAYFGKLQEADIGMVLSAYYTSTKHLQTTEVEHNLNLKNLYQEWEKKFRSNNGVLFLNPYQYGTNNFKNLFPEYEKIANNDLTLNLFFGGAFYEERITKLYDDLMAIGETYTEMIKEDSMDFSADSKIEFENMSAIFSAPDILSVLRNGQLISGFNFGFGSSIAFNDWRNFEDNYTTFKYPNNVLEWGFPHIAVSALNGRVNQMDFSKYNTLYVEMKGENGGESFEVLIKDKFDPYDGSESRLQVTLTDQWEIYEFDIDQFETADKTIIQIPFGILFEGPKGRQIHIKTVQFK